MRRRADLGAGIAGPIFSAFDPKRTSRHPGTKLQQARGLADDCLRRLAETIGSSGELSTRVR